MGWVNRWAKKPVEDTTMVSCRDAAAELEDRFSDSDWFHKVIAGKHENIDVIYLVCKDRCPENHRLYQYQGYPVLIRKQVKANADGCEKAK